MGKANAMSTAHAVDDARRQIILEVVVRISRIGRSRKTHDAFTIHVVERQSAHLTWLYRNYVVTYYVASLGVGAEARPFGPSHPKPS